MSAKFDEHSKAWDAYIEQHILFWWSKNQICDFCARLLGVEGETLRAWLARREGGQE